MFVPSSSMETSSRLSGEGVEGSTLSTGNIATEEFQTTLAEEIITFLSEPQPSATKESDIYLSHTSADQSDADARLPFTTVTRETYASVQRFVFHIYKFQSFNIRLQFRFYTGVFTV